jgi:hypothetical protein
MDLVLGGGQSSAVRDIGERLLRFDVVAPAPFEAARVRLSTRYPEWFRGRLAASENAAFAAAAAVPDRG